jgi:hypothetical protein
MTRRVSGLLLGVAAAGVAALSCKSDPTSSLATNTPATISTSVSRLVVSQGDTGAFQASVMNAQLVPLTLPVTFTACSGTVGTVGVRGDTSYHPPVANKFQAAVAGVAIGPSCVVVSGGGLTDTVDAPVAPIIFTGGTVSSTTPAGGSLLTLTGTSLLHFNATPAVTFGGAIAGDNFSATATQVVVVVPFSNKARLVIDSIAPPYISSNEYELSTVDTVIQTGDFWDGDSSTTTAPQLFPMFPGDSLPAGAKTPMITNLTSGNEVAINNQPLCPDNTAQGPCLFYQFTLADTATLKVSMDWDGSPADLIDLDVFACPAPYSASACQASPEGADGINHGVADAITRPEAFTYLFPAGTHFLVIQRFQTGNPTTTVPPRNIRLTITHP